MDVKISVEEKNREITIPSIFGDVKIEALRTAVVKVDSMPIYSIIYTKNGEFIAVVPPTIMKIKDVINFSQLFDRKSYGDLSDYIKKTIIPAMAVATGYTDIEKFIEEQIIRVHVEDYTGKDHPEKIYSDSIIVEASIGEHSMTIAWKKIDTPAGPTVSRFIITRGLNAYGEKDYLARTKEQLMKLPYAKKDEIIKYAVEHAKELAKNNLKQLGLL